MSTKNQTTPPPTSDPAVASSALLAALRELYEASAMLRLRCLGQRFKVRWFSEWARHTHAMTEAEKVIKANAKLSHAEEKHE